MLNPDYNFGMNRQGFTLIELSIVLVIIGLLVGGILVARSMVTTAGVQNFVRQVQSFDTAVINFKTKYNSIPGDTDLLSPPGNNNGVITDSFLDAGNSYAAYFDRELSNFWHHLSEAGFRPDKVIYSNDASSGLRRGIHIPTSKAMGKKNSGVVFQATNSYWFANWEESVNNQHNYAVNGFNNEYTPIEVLSIDKKMDDGNPAAGSVAPYSYPADGTKCYNGGSYLLNSNIECTIFVITAANIGGFK